MHERFSAEEIRLLQARAERVAAPLQEQTSEGKITALIVRLQGEQYALPIEMITAVYDEVTIIPVPCTPGYVAGIANVRGHLVSVLDLAALLGLEGGSKAGETALVVAEANDASIGLRVEAVGEIIELEKSAMNPPVANSSSECLDGVFAEGLALLNMRAVLDDARVGINESST